MYLKKVEQKTSEILRELNITQTPIPIREIARQIGLTIRPYDWGDDVSGVLVIDQGKGTIGYDPTESSVRQRFTIAHELGHFVLHGAKDELFVDKEFKVMFRNQRSSTGEVRKEQEANSFAASILMPKELLIREIQNHAYDLTDEGVIKKLAKIFDVSQLAMTYRIANLNLF